MIDFIFTFISSSFNNSGASGAVSIVISGFIGLSIIGLVVGLIKKIKGFAFLGG